MQGHSAANLMPVVASYRAGTEVEGETKVTFYGSSYITGGTGEILASADQTTETHITATVDLVELAANRASTEKQNGGYCC